MFNRALQFRVVKQTKQEPGQVTDFSEDFDEKAIAVAFVAEKVVKKVAMAALAYVLVDTVRQVAIARAINHS